MRGLDRGTRAGWLPLAVLVLLAAAGSACEGGLATAEEVRIAGGDAQRGRAVMQEVGCGACHTIPGLDGARGMVGPPLTSWARRSFIAGSLPNAPDNLVRWISDPSSVEPGTAMPDLDLTSAEVRDVAAYLYTLR